MKQLLSSYKEAKEINKTLESLEKAKKKIVKTLETFTLPEPQDDGDTSQSKTGDKNGKSPKLDDEEETKEEPVKIKFRKAGKVIAFKTFLKSDKLKDVRLGLEKMELNDAFVDF